uniref:Ubiquitin-like domain-containing protein n=2 Tax=Hemiselmis andersenii TaxID=464988 RepID=A0A7S1GZW4_HEMAN|mmetsp:Transcript_28834/g.70661  ORF Transcript_28834/g.70661 Transcript_28834/m.70661 type:complete len:575 (+) Transcript_28834:52-1776(+)
MDHPSPVARSLRFTVRCPPPSLLYDKQKHPEKKSGPSGRLPKECLVVLSSATRGANMYFRILHRGETVAEDELKPAAMRRWDEGIEPLGVGLGERLACLAVVPRRGEDAKGQYRERYIGMDESELTVLEYSLDGCVKVSVGEQKEILTRKRTAVVLVTNQREEILVCQPKGIRGGCPLLDPFLWASVKEGESTLAAAVGRVRESLRVESPQLMLLASREFEGAGHVDIYRCSIRATSTKAAQITKDLNLLHAAFLPAFSLLYMSKGAVGPEELNQAAKLFLVDGSNDLDSLYSMGPVDAFLCKWDGGHSARSGEGFFFDLELFSDRVKEERGTLGVRISVTPSNTLAQLFEAVRAATVSDRREGGVPSDRLRLVSGGIDLVDKAAGAAGLEDRGTSMTLFDLEALTSIESGAVHARIRCPAVGRAEFLVLQEMAASGLLPKTRGAGSDVQNSNEAGQRGDNEPEEITGEGEPEGGEPLQSTETQSVTDAKRAWHKMLKRKERSQKFAEMLGQEAKALEDRLNSLAADLLSSHVRGDRVGDLMTTSSDIRLVGRVLGAKPSSRGSRGRITTKTHR